jgi:hypothetical protein
MGKHTPLIARQRARRNPQHQHQHPHQRHRLAMIALVVTDAARHPQGMQLARVRVLMQPRPCSVQHYPRHQQTLCHHLSL